VTPKSHNQVAHTDGVTASPHLGEPIHSGYVLTKRAHLANVTSLEHERWKRAYFEFCRRVGIG